VHIGFYSQVVVWLQLPCNRLMALQGSSLI